MKILIDAFGGDHSPEEVIAGTMSAMEENKNFTADFVGKQEVIENLLKEKQITITALCKKHKFSRSAFYDTLNAKLYFCERLAKILDSELDTRFLQYMKGGKNVAISKE